MSKFTVTAIMTKFYDGSVEREIEVPEHEAMNASVNSILDLAFKYGQNDYQPRNLCSVSVGDVICVEEKDAPKQSWMTDKGRMRSDVRFFEVKGVGFEEITMRQLGSLEDIAKANPNNASMVARYQDGIKAEAKAEAKAKLINYDEEPIAPCRQAIHDEINGYDNSNY